MHNKIRGEEEADSNNTRVNSSNTTSPECDMKMPVMKIGLKYYLPNIPVVLFHHCPNCIPFKLCFILAALSGHCSSYLPLIQLRSSQTCSGFKQRPLWSTLKTSCFKFYNLASLLCKLSILQSVRMVD